MTTTATTATTTTTTTKRNYVSFFRAKDNFSAWNHEKQFFRLCSRSVSGFSETEKRKPRPTHSSQSCRRRRSTKIPSFVFFGENFFSVQFCSGEGERDLFQDEFQYKKIQQMVQNVVLPSLNRYLKVNYFK